VLARANLLVVDDDRAHRECVGEVLERAGHAVLLAATGREALGIARARPVDACLLDVEMPGLDGFETAVRLRRLRSGLPVVFVTGSTSDESRRRAEELSCFAWLAKPVARQELVSVARRLVRTRVVRDM
jgi:CheY-like chemotaxis protein